MTVEDIKKELNKTKDFFERSTRMLKEEHSTFAPQPGLFTVAGHIAHTAQTIEWFYEGAFAGNWRMDFEVMDKAVRGVTSVTKAREWFSRAIDKAIRETEAHTEEEWSSRFPPNPIMGEVERKAMIGAIVDHTAHHRGALTVYQRLLGLTPLMPYMEP